MSDVTEGRPLIDLAAVHGEEEERMILQCPDLQGIAILPMTQKPPAASEEEQWKQSQRQPDIMLLRSSFVGDVFFAPCFFFSALPDGHAARLRKQQPVTMTLPVRTGTEGQLLRAKLLAERQRTGAVDGAEGDVPMADRHLEGEPRQKGLTNLVAERQDQKANLPACGQEPFVPIATDQPGPSQAPASNGDHAPQGQIQSHRKRKAQSQDPNNTRIPHQEGQNPAERAEIGHLSHQKANSERVEALEQAPPDADPMSMLRHIDIRQSIPNKAHVKRQRQADPRWTTNKHEVLFDQKGLFQTDISVHHALLAAALQNYHSAQIAAANIDPHTQSRTSDSPTELRQLHSDAQGSCSELPGNEWGFEHMAERMAAAAKASEEEEHAAESGLIIRLPELQGSTTIDEVEARTRWETANAEGRNAAFDPAVPGPRFKAPDKAAAIARAIPVVSGAFRSLQAGPSSSKTHQAASFLSFDAAVLAPAVAVACQDSGVARQPRLEFCGERVIPLTSWKGASLGADSRTRRSGDASQLPDSQASVRQPSQSTGVSDDDRRRIPLVAADRVVGGGQLACPVTPARSWGGALLTPPAHHPSVLLNSYYADMGPGQEQDDIEELEGLWLSARGLRRDTEPSSSAHAMPTGQQGTPAAPQQGASAQPQTQTNQQSAAATGAPLRSAVRRTASMQPLPMMGHSNPQPSTSKPATASFAASPVDTSQVRSTEASASGGSEPKQSRGRKSVQFAATQAPQRRLVDVIADRRRRQSEENASAARKAVSPEAINASPSGQIATALPAQSLQLPSVPRSKPNAKRTTPRSSFVEGF